ncbi:MAG: intradiol ring-cleavage dioxygenase [Solirubrobacteraceae bacterium]|nr:intradiol ring-cleavage dioxygenase [Solirubrobacteraceae bacterium]
MSSDTPDPRFALLRRREALAALGAAGLGAAFGARGLLRPDAATSADCVLQREVTEGPYYLDLDLLRRDIREGRPGIPLALLFTVVDASSCAIIRGATVEIWHADAGGIYSGVSGDSGKYLRGGQKTDGRGRARFTTIYPGWYQGRTPHIHMKVFVGGDEVHTGQVFFRETVTRSVYRRGVYAARGQADTSNAADSIYREAGSRALLALRRRNAKSLSSGLTGSLTIGINPS